VRTKARSSSGSFAAILVSHRREAEFAEIIFSLCALCVSAVNKETKTGFKSVDFFRGQGFIRFKSGAYTIVREHFEANYNAAIGKKMRF
jgi:hypothetical protein